MKGKEKKTFKQSDATKKPDKQNKRWKKKRKKKRKKKKKRPQKPTKQKTKQNKTKQKKTKKHPKKPHLMNGILIRDVYNKKWRSKKKADQQFSVMKNE